MSEANEREMDDLRIAFGQYGQDRDETRIAQFSPYQLDAALIRFRRSADKPFYHAIERRLLSLKESADTSRRRKEVWIERAVTFLLGIAGGLVIAWVVWKMKWN